MIAPSLNQRLWWQWVTTVESPPPPQLIPVVKRFRGLAPDTVEQGLRDIVRRHDVLRAHFWVQDGELAAALNDPDAFGIEIQRADSDQGVADKVKEFSGRAMAVSDPWLTRAMLITAADGEVVAVLSINHMIFDGPSFFLLDAELGKIGQTGSASPPAIGFFDYAQWDRDWFAARGSDLVDYWRHWSQTIPTLHCPESGAPVIWLPGPRLPGTFLMPPQVAPLVRRMAAKLSTSPFLIYLTVFAMTIARWSGQARFGLRNVGDARLQPELSSVRGYMTMTDPIEVNIDEGENFGTNLKRIERDFLAALQLRLPSLHAFLPYMIEPRDCTPETANNLAVLINYHPPKPGVLPAPDAPIEEGPWPPSVKQHDALDWTHPVPAIVLDIMDQEEGPGIVSGLFRLNGALLTEGERDALIATFFEAFSEQVLRA